MVSKMMTLSKKTEHPYTFMEYKLFNMLPKDGSAIGCDELARKRVALGPWDVANPRTIMAVMMNRLIDKVDLNKEQFMIHKDGKRPGHHKVEYSLMRRKKKRAA